MDGSSQTCSSEECSEKASLSCQSSHKQPSSLVLEPVSKRTKSQVAESSSRVFKGKEKQHDASPEEVPDSKFLNADAESHYSKKFSTKGVILKREVLLDELTHLRFSDKIVSRGWEGLLTKLIPPSEEVVREFYSNIHAISDINSFAIYFCGTFLDVHPFFLAQCLSIPRVNHPVFPYNASARPSPSTMAT
ncbi:hypothetical protein CJ030_MR3G012363 [Morella rubra]|uniref:Uncharacterized protein n=1 Tax=Morella rubra TaxID=262757 RepID=A0A6A1W638_9ROSI|nr:hypothetical protein CJ030_MR3G012363 [Morella rubra]